MINLYDSPVRKNLSTLRPDQLAVFEDYDGALSQEDSVRYQMRTVMKDIENMIDAVTKNQSEKTRIAIMGEVKAGKSTFINACLGKKIAYTDILEATAIISEIVYSEHEYARVLDLEGNIAYEFSFEELLDWTEERIDGEEGFGQFRMIQIGVNSDFLKDMILVDTPGLLSITSQNHNITNQYIAQADYILWVLNKNNLGAKSVNDFIDKIYLTGKPLIGVVNKLDNPNDIDEIKNYVVKEYGSVFEEIFYVSAINAWKMRGLHETLDAAKHIGIEPLLECMLDLSCDKEHSETSTKRYQLEREREVHRKILEIVKKRKMNYDGDCAVCRSINEKMKNGIAEELRNWIQTSFFAKEREALLRASKEEYDELFRQYADAVYLSELIDEKQTEMYQYIERKWNVASGGIKKTPQEICINFNFDIDRDSEESLAEDNSTQKGTIDRVKQTMTRGLTFGTMLAGYSAWLGPAASYVTLTAALPYALPIGIGAAVFSSYIFQDKKGESMGTSMSFEKRKRAQVDSLCEQIRKRMKEEYPRLKSALDTVTNHYCNANIDRLKDMVRQVNFDFSEPKYGEFVNALEDYIQKIDDEIRSYTQNEVELPPEML